MTYPEPDDQSAAGPLRILLVGSDPLARSGLAAALAAQPRREVIGQVGAELDPVEALALYRPDALVFDLGWGGANDPGSGEIMELLRASAAAGLPAMALVEERGTAQEAWAAGARGLFPREGPTQSLSAALESLAEGLVVIHPLFVGAAIRMEEAPDELPAEQLTPRERQVLQLLAEGLSNRSIAYQLEISEHTVKFHVNAILRKLNAQSRTEAVVRGTRLGLILL